MAGIARFVASLFVGAMNHPTGVAEQVGADFALFESRPRKSRSGADAAAFRGLPLRIDKGRGRKSSPSIARTSKA
jgi:hypothetical protein